MNTKRVINDWSTYMVEIYQELPLKAKELFFGAVFNLGISDKYLIETCHYCKSPIEQIFYVAFRIVEIIRVNDIPDEYLGFHVIPQYDFNIDGKTYYVDFLIIFENIKEPNKSYTLIVECDGHEFHEKTKEQVKRDNERSYDLKKHGEDILRFSGSQINNDPIKCANDVFDYILTKAKAV